MEKKEFEYDVAFSLLDQDETLAAEIDEQIKYELKTFLYTRKQKESLGKDGFKTLSETFEKDSRIVVVLFREGYGGTKWTKVEEKSIATRVFNNLQSVEFIVFVRLDQSPFPHWFKNTDFYFNINNYSIEQLAGAIKYKVENFGGVIKEESFLDSINKKLREKEFKEDRYKYLTNPQTKYDIKKEFDNILDWLNKTKKDLNEEGIDITIPYRTHENLSWIIIEVICSTYMLTLRWNLNRMVKGSELLVQIGNVDIDHGRKEMIYENMFKPNYSKLKTIVWENQALMGKEFSSIGLIEEMLGKLLACILE